MSKIVDTLKHRAQSRSSMFMAGDQLVEVRDHIERLEASVIHLGNEIKLMAASDLRALVLSEVSDFFAGLGSPGEPESVEDAQRQLVARIEAVWSANGKDKDA